MPVAGIESARPGGPRPPRFKRHRLTPFLFLLPTFVFLVYFLYYPASTAFIGAFTEWDGFNPPQFVGFDNFVEVFTDPVIREGAGNNLIWAAIHVVLAIVPPFIVAELIFHLRGRRSKYVYRTLFVIPLVIPFIVGVLLWRYFYDADGLLNYVLGLAHLDGLQQQWMANPSTALYALALIGFPWVAPFNMLIFFAGLQEIPKEVLESAELDGASGVRRVFALDIPLVLAQGRLLVLLAVISSLQNIVVPLVMTNGGPGYSTYVPALSMYNVAVVYGRFGYSMAISFVLFLVIMLLSGVVARLMKTR